MEEKRKPGRPKVDAGFIEKEKNTHRAAVNYKYAMDAADLIDRHADKIPDGKLLWFMDVEKQEAYGRNGTCVQFVLDCTCPNCGEQVKAWTCHYCV